MSNILINLFYGLSAYIYIEYICYKTSERFLLNCIFAIATNIEPRHHITTIRHHCVRVFYDRMANKTQCTLILPVHWLLFTSRNITLKKKESFLLYICPYRATTLFALYLLWTVHTFSCCILNIQYFSIVSTCLGSIVLFVLKNG